MKRFHIHLSVADLDQATGFYSRLFGSEPSVRKDDYAKWLLRAESKNESAAKPAAPARNQSPAQRKQTKPLRDKLKQAEQQMEKLQQQISGLDQQLADPALYNGPPTELARLSQDQARLRDQLDAAEAQWLAAMEALESA